MGREPAKGPEATGTKREIWINGKTKLMQKKQPTWQQHVLEQPRDPVTHPNQNQHQLFNVAAAAQTMVAVAQKCHLSYT